MVPAASQAQRAPPSTVGGVLDVRTARWPAWIAAGLAFASAGVSAYWTLGGTALLDTVGGAIEGLARRSSLGSGGVSAEPVATGMTA